MAVLLPLDRITDNPWQTRQRYEKNYIEGELAPSVARSGLLQTPTGRVVNGAGAPQALDALLLASQSSIDELLAGKPRWRVQLAFAHNRRRAFDFLYARSTPVPGLDRPGHMPVNLRLLSNEEMANQAWTENEQRSDLNPVERARAVERRMTSFGWKQKKAAEEMGLSRSRIANMLRLLVLPDRVLDAVAGGVLSERAALSMVPLFTLPQPMDVAARVYTVERWKDGAYRDVMLFDEIINEACAGALRSDAIRQNVEWLIEHVTEPLGLIDPKHDYGDAECAVMQQGACTPDAAKRCPLLVEAKERHGEKKTVLRCGDPACHAEKLGRAAGIILKAAHEETGLPITTIDDENRATTFDRYGSGKKLGARLVRKGCPEKQLHIRLAGSHPGYCLTGKGHPKAELVCVHAAGGHCACMGQKTASGSNDRSAQQAAAAQETRRGRAQARLVGEELYAAPAKQAVLQALLDYNPLAWNVVMKIVSSGWSTSWGNDYDYKRSKRGFFDKTPPASFEDLCRMLAEWTGSVEVHHYGDCADSLQDVEQFARRRMEAMGLSYEEPDYGAVDIDQVADLATLSPSEETFSTLLSRAGLETLRDVARRITDEAGKPTRGHKARLQAIRSRLAAMEEPEPVPA